MNNAYIYNNTIYTSTQLKNAGVTAAYMKNWNTGINNVFFYNNIFFTTPGVPLINIPTGYSAFFAGNIYWSSGSAFSVYYQGTHYTTLDSWRTTGNEKVGGLKTGFYGDPMLAHTGEGGTIGFGNSLNSLDAYKINNASSPATSAAQNLLPDGIDVGLVDFWGTLLPGAAINDIGANQHSIVLPMRLLNFYGRCLGSGNQVSWSSAEETNMKSIELLYSADGRSYVPVSEIKPRGSNSFYQFTNDSTAAGNNFYQLKLNGLDGNVDYSSVIIVKCESPASLVKVGPNPFSQYLQINLASVSGGLITMVLYDVQGKMRAEKKVQMLSGNNSIIFDGVNHLPAGVYWLQVSNADKVEQFKLIKSVN
jgi:hypothetical protein